MIVRRKAKVLWTSIGVLFSLQAAGAQADVIRSENLLSDPSFERGWDGFEMRDGGDVELLNTRPLSAPSSLLARLSQGSSELWYEHRLTATMSRVSSVKTSARIRNDSVEPVTFAFCAFAYDTDWNPLRNCESHELGAGMILDASVQLDFPALKALERIYFVIDNENQSAITLTIDDATLRIDYEPQIAGNPVPDPVDPGTTPDDPIPEPSEEPVAQPGPLPGISGHPRLWLTPNDLPRLKRWARADNPVYQALRTYAERLRSEMDRGDIPSLDAGGPTWNNDPSEAYASVFAFMSLIAPDAHEAANWAQRARSCLMHVINQALPGRLNGRPFRQEDFSLNDRSRWWGEGFGLTVDWIYPYLSDADKASIRTVFLRWSRELILESYHRPEPVNMLNNPLLTADRSQVRWSNNNYFNAAMRNVGLMAMSFDAVDDPRDELRGRLHYATGAWLYIADNLQKTDARGGLLAEGFEYSPQSLAYQAQFLWALRTSGYDQPQFFGPQVAFNTNFWQDVWPAFLHSSSPQPIATEDFGSVYQPAWFGAGQNFFMPDLIAALTPLALRAMADNDQRTLQAIRWMQKNMAPGGAAEFIDRIQKPQAPITPVFYFLLFDPDAPLSNDPRPSLPLTHVADGIGRILTRTDWSPEASFFNFTVTWAGIDHQTGDALSFDFYRQGEWLTRRRVGYSEVDYAMSDNHNTLTVENSKPDHDDPRRRNLWLRGSQDAYSTSGNPQLLAKISNKDYVYALGDATSSYNSEHEGTHDVSHVSRSIVFLKKDTIVVYDRVETFVADRFKRFHLQLPAAPTIQQKLATMTTPKGQKLFVSSLLPLNTTLSVTELRNESSGTPARLETLSHRLTVEANGRPNATRFLTVLQGADAGQNASPRQLIQSTGVERMSGVLLNGTVVLFPEYLQEIRSVSYKVPVSTRHHLITGLKPGASYGIERHNQDGSLTVTLKTGGSLQADTGGTLWFE